MNQIIQKQDKWVRPWHIKKFNELNIRDERFFSILIKGALNWLNKNIIMYNEPINHFIFNTGSAYMYVESNGYEFSWSETSGEDQMYMHLPRCVCELADINIPQEELTNPFVRGIYERKSSLDNKFHGYTAEIRRLPLEVSMNLHYVLSNFNESIILIQELIDKMVFQRYYKIVYLGQIIQCSIEFPNSSNIQTNKIDFDSTETNQKLIDLSIKIDTYYPIINNNTEFETSHVIESFEYNTDIIDDVDNILDENKYIVE